MDSACASHPEANAVAACRVCGRAACILCLSEEKEGSFCSPRCVGAYREVVGWIVSPAADVAPAPPPPPATPPEPSPVPAASNRKGVVDKPSDIGPATIPAPVPERARRLPIVVGGLLVAAALVLGAVLLLRGGPEPVAKIRSRAEVPPVSRIEEPAPDPAPPPPAVPETPVTPPPPVPEPGPVIPVLKEPGPPPPAPNRRPTAPELAIVTPGPAVRKREPVVPKLSVPPPAPEPPKTRPRPAPLAVVMPDPAPVAKPAVPPPPPEPVPPPAKDPGATLEDRLKQASELIREATPLFTEVADRNPLPASLAALRALLGKAERAQGMLVEARTLYAEAVDRVDDPAAVRRRIRSLDDVLTSLRAVVADLRRRLE